MKKGKFIKMKEKNVQENCIKKTRSMKVLYFIMKFLIYIQKIK